MDSETYHRVATRFRSAQADDAVEKFVDDLVDHFCDTLYQHTRSNERNIEPILMSHGVNADKVNELDDVREAGPSVKVLGGLIRQGLWYLLSKPFIAVKKLIGSPQFRRGLKVAFRRALSHDMRATRHLGQVLERMALGEAVKPQEKSSALKHLIVLLAKVAAVYFAGPEVIGSLFTGGVWAALSKLTVDLLAIFLDTPIRATLKQMMSDLG